MEFNINPFKINNSLLASKESILLNYFVFQINDFKINFKTFNTTILKLDLQDLTTFSVLLRNIKDEIKESYKILNMCLERERKKRYIPNLFSVAEFSKKCGILNIDKYFKNH